MQKKEIRKRNARKIIDPNVIDESTQTKLVNFGVIHYKEVKSKKQKLDTANQVIYFFFKINILKLKINLLKLL